MFARVLASDAACNGRFFTGVLTTGIYCLPSCKARKPKPENVRFFPTVEAARAAGLRPCKKCHPDDYARGADPVLEDVEISAWKVGFLGSVDVVNAVAELLADYSQVPLVTYAGNFHVLDESQTDDYIKAMQDLILPQTRVLTGNIAAAKTVAPDFTDEKLGEIEAYLKTQGTFKDTTFPQRNVRNSDAVIEGIAEFSGGTQSVRATLEQKGTKWELQAINISPIKK